MVAGFYNQSALLTMSSCVILKWLLELFLGVKEGGGGAEWDTRIPRGGPLKQKMGTQPITMLYCADWIF